jgi:porin
MPAASARHLMMKTFAFIVFSGFLASPLFAAELSEKPTPQSAGFDRSSEFSRNPVDIGNQLRKDDEFKDSAFRFPRFDEFFQPWFDFKSRLNRDYGLQFGLAWTPLVQGASSSPGENRAAGGIFELFGKWTLFGRGTDHPGSLGFRVEDRHRLGTDLAPQLLGSETGSTWSTATGFGEFNLSVPELWWEQHLIKDHLAFRAGKMLAFAVYDYFRFKSPKTGFLNQMFNVNPTIPFPSFGLGATVLVRPWDDIYIVAGIHDANGQPTRVGFDTFFDDREYFTALELGWDPGHLSGRREGFFDGADYHVTLWHADARERQGTPSGRGFLVAAEQPIGDQVLFARYGYADGNVTPLGQMAAAGVAFTNVFGEDADVIAIGASWGRNNLGRFPVDIDDSGDLVLFDADGLDQYAIEAFYRMQLTPRLSITPDVQLIIDPALNVDKSSIGYLGVRARFAL